MIAGLGRNGCDVEIKPGNASCKFRALNENGAESRQHVTSAGKATLDLLDIELRGADRTCSVAITVLEPGQPAKTIYRGFRLSARTEGDGLDGVEGSGRSFLYLLSQLSIEGYQGRPWLQHAEIRSVQGPAGETCGCMDLLIVGKVMSADAFVSYTREAHQCTLEPAQGFSHADHRLVIADSLLRASR